MAAPPKISASKEQEWKPFTEEEYRSVARRLVHFSAKGVNSNAEPFGIRLCGDAALALPYISVRCLMGKGVGVATDYTKNTGSVATVVKQVRALVSGEAEVDFDLARDYLAAIAEASAGAHVEGVEQVSPRLRQILLPKDDSYVAVTPLPSGGLSREINRRVQSHNEHINAARKESPKNRQVGERLRLGSLGVGGAKPQNVGSLARDMQSVLVFRAPAENLELRIAYAIHHRGIRLGLPRRFMIEWRDWRIVARARHDGRLPTDMEHRDAERDKLVIAAHAVLHQGERALRRLQEHRSLLPGGLLLSPKLQDAVIRGLIDPAERGRDWPRHFGEQVAHAVGAYLFPDGGVEPLDQSSLHQIARWVEELAR